MAHKGGSQKKSEGFYEPKVASLLDTHDKTL